MIGYTTKKLDLSLEWTWETLENCLQLEKGIFFNAKKNVSETISDQTDRGNSAAFQHHRCGERRSVDVESCCLFWTDGESVVAAKHRFAPWVPHEQGISVAHARMRRHWLYI